MKVRNNTNWDEIGTYEKFRRKKKSERNRMFEKLQKKGRADERESKRKEMDG